MSDHTTLRFAFNSDYNYLEYFLNILKRLRFLICLFISIYGVSKFGQHTAGGAVELLWL